MKAFIKITTICSLLIIAGLLISSCGGSTENFVQGNGKVTVNVTGGGAPLANVQVDANANSPTGPSAGRLVTGASGSLDFQLTVGSDYFFTFTDLNTTARFVSPHSDPSRITPLLTATVPLNEILF